MMGSKLVSALSFLFLIVSISSDNAQRSSSEKLSDDYHRNASFYGLQVVPRGELLTFQSYWDEVIVINLPQPSEYENFLSAINNYCNSMNTRQFQVYEQDLHLLVGRISRAEWIKREMRERCRRAKDEVRAVVTDLVDAAFKFSMPQPNQPQIDPLVMITNMDNFNLGMNEDEYEEESIFQNVSFANTTLPPARRESTTETAKQDEILTTTFSPTSSVPTSTQSSTTLTYTLPGEQPTINLSSSPYVEDDYDVPNTGTQRQADTREKRALFFLATAAITAIATLLVSSITGTVVALENKYKIDQMKLKVKKLVDISNEQDNESVALREFMIGMTTENVGKFNKTGSVLSTVLQIQNIFSKSINRTASSLRLYSKGDALANTMFLNLHEEQDFITKVSAVIDGARRVITSYEQGIISLYQNQLSTAFVSHQQLRSILFKIRHNLPPGFTLAFDMSELENYYFYRLCQHRKVGNQLILRLTVPLSANNLTPPLSLFTPVFNTVPLPRAWEKQAGLELSGNFYRINEKALYWVLKSGKFESVVDRDHLSCTEAGNYLKCIRFEPTPSIVPSTCIKSLMAGNFSPEIIFSASRKSCKPFLMPPESYKIMRLDDETMVLHGSTLLNYRMVCKGQKTEPIEVAEDILMKVVPLAPGCQIEMNGILFPGPILRGAVSNTTFNMSSGIRDVVFTNQSNLFHYPLLRNHLVSRCTIHPTSSLRRAN